MKSYIFLLFFYDGKRSYIIFIFLISGRDIVNLIQLMCHDSNILQINIMPQMTILNIS